MDKFKLGVIVGTRGIKGDLVLSEAVRDITLPEGIIAYVGYSENYADKMTLQSINGKIVHLSGINSKEEAERLKEKAIFVSRDAIIKNNSNFIFEDDIIGCDVIANAQIIGKVIEIWEMPANNVWLVEMKDGKLPLPVIDDVIKEVDTNNKRIEIELIDGLMDIVY